MAMQRLGRCRSILASIERPAAAPKASTLVSDSNARRTFSATACVCQQGDQGQALAGSSSSTSRPRQDIPPALLQYLQSLKNVTAFDPSFDFHPGLTKSAPPVRGQRHPATVTHVTKTPQNTPATIDASQTSSKARVVDPAELLTSVTQLSSAEIRSLFRFPLIVKRVVNMTGKGKIPSMFALVVVGNGKGLVGVGEGKDDAVNKAVNKAFVQAVKSMDYVRRFEERTVSSVLESNFGTTKIQMRPRPPGFGLRVNHFIHQVAKAAGIKDLSAKVLGSRNGVRVIKLAVRMLHGGSVPVDLDDGFGAKGQRRNKKTRGMSTPEEVGRLRGRKAVGS